MSEKHLLLIGGGHAHVAVLADWIKHGAPARTTLITPSPRLRYSGMVPGWIAGEYARDEGLVDLAGLAQRAGVELVLDRCIGIDGDAQRIETETSGPSDFDIASLDTGGVGRSGAILGEDPRLLDIRPIDVFVADLDDWMATNEVRKKRIAVIGGGAGGVELAFGLRNSGSSDVCPEVTLVAGSEGLLPAFTSGVRTRVRAELAAQTIHLIESDAQLLDGHLQAGDHSLESVDLIVAALGSAAPVNRAAIGLDCDLDGFIAVDRHQRSISHRNIFAAGDVAARQDRDVPHSGVHAVHTGPVLARNLRAALSGETPSQSYQPRPASLYLLSTGNGSAIASYGAFAAQGRWAAKLKRWIDKRWIGTYARLASGQ